MARIRGLELLFNLVKSKLKSKGDCVVAAIHCLLVNENLQCVGTGEAFSEADAASRTELLPEGWNDNQDVYTLRYMSKDSSQKYLIKIVKAGHILHVNVVLNEDTTAAMSANTNKVVGEEFGEYATAYQELDTLCESFRTDILEKLHGSPSKPKPQEAKQQPAPPRTHPVPPNPGPQARPDLIDYPDDHSPLRGGRSAFPEVGGRDLDPFGRGQGGGMFFDPSSFGAPSRPFTPPFGMPRGAVPPGARFDPFGPPIRGPDRFRPNPDHFKPPDFDDFM